MKIFSVVVSETRQRKVRLAARDGEAAVQAARAVLKQGERVVSCRLWGERDTWAAREALHHLLSRDFLERDADIRLCVEEWIEAAAQGDPGANEVLALAGLRVTGHATEQRLLVGSPASVPALAEWFRNTPWAGSELPAVLATFDEAARTNCTFAGFRSRAVSLPLALVRAAGALQ